MSTRLTISLASLWLCCTVSVAQSEAPTLPTTPVPRVAPGKHFGFITKTDVSADGRYAITVAEDKTARIWDLERQRLHKTLRVPVGDGHQGKLTVGTINPAGTFAAVAGYTGLADGQPAIIYIFDLTTGVMYTSSDLPMAAVDNLLFSRNGRYLAVGMANGRGLLVFDLSQSGAVAHHFDTESRIYGLAWGPNETLVATALDGVLHRYEAPSFDRTASVDLGGEPMHVRYSPDDTQLVVGYRSSPKVAVLDARSLSAVRELDASQQPDLVGLIAAEWSDDGRFVFAGGRTKGDIRTPLLRWDLSKPAAPEVILMAPRRIGDIHRTGRGTLLYGSGQPTLGLITTEGRELWHVPAATADIRATSDDNFKVAPDGLGVQFPYDREGTRSGFFDPLNIDPTFRLEAVSVPDTLLPARRNGNGWRVSYEREASELSLNGQQLALETLESPRAHALSADNQTLFLGTGWFLRAYDADGNVSWRTPLTGAAQLVNASADGRWVVTALADGTVRWFRAGDGELVLSLFPHANGDDWIAWIPQGYYLSSLYGDELIGWQVNKGWRQAPEFYRAVQFERVLYRPDVVQAYVRSGGDPSSIDELLGEDSFSIADLESIAPPSLNVAANPGDESGAANLTIAAASGPLPMQELSVYVNGIPVNAGRERRLRISESSEFERALSLPLEPGENLVRVEVANGSSLGVEELYVDASPDTTPLPGDLYVLTIGVSQFDDRDVPDLGFAAKDARDIAAHFAEDDGLPFANVYTETVADSGPAPPTRDNVVRALNFVQRAGPRDTVILFFASHGLSVADNYYFAPSDARIDVEPDEDITTDKLVLDTFLSWQELFEPMRLAAGRRLMIVDTCASGNVSGPADLFTLQKRSASSKIAFMTASAGNQYSQELGRKQQGLFTFSLLTALRDGYDPNADGVVTLNEAFTLTSQLVPNWRENKALEQTPQLMSPDFLTRMALAKVTDKE